MTKRIPTAAHIVCYRLTDRINVLLFDAKGRITTLDVWDRPGVLSALRSYPGLNRVTVVVDFAKGKLVASELEHYGYTVTTVKGK